MIASRHDNVNPLKKPLDNSPDMWNTVVDQYNSDRNMILRIDTTSSVPVYAQLVDQVKRAIAVGALKSGDPLPSLRETAVRLRVNPLTVSKAYKQLEAEGLIETRHGLGSFVTTDTAVITDGFRRDVLVRAIDDLLVDSHHLGVTVEDLRRLVEERIASTTPFDSAQGGEIEGGNTND